jgi:hypothetical protein
MKEILSNGSDYIIASAGVVVPGYVALGAAPTAMAARQFCREDWSSFWAACGIVPSRSISVLEI